jgi:hypothetical protein
MSGRRMWLLVLALIIAAVLLLVAGRSARTPPDSGDVLISFVALTNPPAPANAWPFTLLSVSNRSGYAVTWHGDWVEIDGNPSHRARIENRSLPFLPLSPVLKSGGSFLIAVGRPLDSSQSGRWRFSMAFTRHNLEERWVDFAQRRHLPQFLERLAETERQRILDPDNQSTASSPWLDR